MMKKVIMFTGLLIAMTSCSFAQNKTKVSQQQIWTGYFNQSRFSNKWGVWVDVHLRTKEDFFNNFSQAIFRGGLTYYLNDVTKLTVGDAYISHFPADAHKKITQPEHRPWQQLQWHTVYPKVRTMQWLRLEERFRRKILNDSTLRDGSSFNFRARYNFLLMVPLTKGKIKSGDVSVVLNNEVHINFGKQILNNTFDQNRAFIGFAYHLNNHDNLQFGYMNIWQQMPGLSSYRSIHAARVFYFHNLDLRGKQDL
jgi:hypothetical protein